MRTYDLTPLFRTSVGFDRMSRLMDAALQMDGAAKGYPPYNIVRRDNDLYRITLAVAGFGEEDLGIELHENLLTVTGSQASHDDEIEYLHHGIAGRAFERRFQLADHIKVRGASLENGLLHVDLEREVPEALKPRRIPIGGSRQPALHAAE
ncbi:MAG: Hsp20 family protein [Myxococcota bacterium]|nr:Hsp20 family protein [Myxococcota bacterium]